MLRVRLTGWLLLALLLAFAPVSAASAQTSGAFTISLDTVGGMSSVVSGKLTNVPTGATGASVTLTLGNGAKRETTTSAAQEWKFSFSDAVMGGPWIQISAVASNGAGTSLANAFGGGLANVSQGAYGSNYSLPLYPYGWDAWGGYGYGGYGGGYGGYGYGYPFGGYGYGGYGGGYGFGGYGYPYGGNSYAGYGYPYGYRYGYPFGYGWLRCW